MWVVCNQRCYFSDSEIIELQNQAAWGVIGDNLQIQAALLSQISPITCLYQIITQTWTKQVCVMLLCRKLFSIIPPKLVERVRNSLSYCIELVFRKPTKELTSDLFFEQLNRCPNAKLSEIIKVGIIYHLSSI